MSDYIDRDELIKHVKDLSTWWEDGGGVYGPPMKYPEGLFYPEDVIASIENAPAADVQEIKHGKWKLCYEDWRRQIAGDECSACGFQHYGACISHYHYCPNCGAKMDGGNNNA